MDNRIQDYLKSEQFIGFDQFFIVQRRLDGYGKGINEKLLLLE